jgi:sterol desaturase/sphingolipid hydroxylase (fatty acid hydroxylase superfamily)
LKSNPLPVGHKLARHKVMSATHVAEATLWPALVIATSVSLYAAFEAGLGEIALILSGPILLGLITVLEELLPRDASKQALGDPQLLNDIGHTFAANTAIVTVGGLLILATAVPIAVYASETWGSNLWPTDWPWAAQVALAMLATDGLEYGRHRMVHRVPWLWRLHALHHSVDRLHAIKGGRVHLLDRLTTTVVIFAPLVACGIPESILLWSAVPIIALSPLAHSNVRFRLPAIAHRLLVTPDEHRLHHARDLSLANANYAAAFPFWDMLFGTFEAPEDHPPPQLGIEDDRTPRGFVDQILAPLGRAPRAAAGRR